MDLRASPDLRFAFTSGLKTCFSNRKEIYSFESTSRTKYIIFRVQICIRGNCVDEEPRRLKFAFDCYFFWKFFFSSRLFLFFTFSSPRSFLSDYYSKQNCKLDLATYNYTSHSDNVDGIFSPRLKKSLHDQIWIKSRYTGF